MKSDALRWTIEQLEAVERFDEEIVDRLERLVHRCRRHQQRPTTRIVLPGFSTISPKGDTIMANQTLNLNTAYTAPLTYTDTQGNPSAVLAGETASLSDPAAGSIALSAAGNAVNVTLTKAGPVNYTISGTNADGATVTASGTLTAATDTATTTITVGTFAPGTTA